MIPPGGTTQPLNYLTTQLINKKKELEMAKEKKDLNKWYITRYSKEKERIFLFYAAVAMSILYGYCRLF